MLSVDKLNAFYGPVQILHDIDLAVGVGQIVALVGANAAGKSTLMFSLAGLRTRCTGRISIEGEEISALPAYDRVLRGLVLVPERRRLFPFMTVLENLEIGAYSAVARPIAQRDARAGLFAAAGARRAPQPDRRIAQRRRAADARHRARADGEAARAAAR